MIAIVLAASKECEEKLKAEGFVQQTVWLKPYPVQSLPTNKRAIEHAVRSLAPYQFLVSDYWGMMPE